MADAEPEEADNLAEVFGTRLYQTIFNPETLGSFRYLLEEACQGNTSLCIRLHLHGQSEIEAIPWEYMHAERFGFLATFRATPIVRMMDLEGSVAPVEVASKLKVLVVIAQPADEAWLDVEREYGKMKAALDECAGLRVELRPLRHASFEALARELRGHRSFHVLHYIGHGAFDPAKDEGQQLLEDGDGHRELVNARLLATALRGHSSLRLIILNSCEGARPSATGTFRGTAQALIQRGIPAVLAMQSAIYDDAAVRFSSVFYQSLARGYPVSACVSEARMVMHRDGSLEWGKPVLYLRSPGGLLFDLQVPKKLQSVIELFQGEQHLKAARKTREIELADYELSDADGAALIQHCLRQARDFDRYELHRLLEAFLQAVTPRFQIWS